MTSRAYALADEAGPETANPAPAHGRLSLTTTAPEIVVEPKDRAGWRRRSAEREIRRAQGIACYTIPAFKAGLVEMLRGKGLLTSQKPTQAEITIAFTQYVAAEIAAAHA